jgi:hypothetical protein
MVRLHNLYNIVSATTDRKIVRLWQELKHLC